MTPPVILMIISLLLFSLVIIDYNGFVKTFMNNWVKIKMEELKTRRIEALAKMEEPSRQRLLETMPDWLDPKDQKDVEAWKKAKAEVIKVKK